MNNGHKSQNEQINKQAMHYKASYQKQQINIQIQGNLINEYEKQSKSNSNGNINELKYMKNELYNILSAGNVKIEDIQKLQKISNILTLSLRSLTLGQQLDISKLTNQLKQFINFKSNINKQQNKNLLKTNQTTKMNSYQTPINNNNNSLDDIKDTINKSKQLINQLSVKNNKHLNLKLLANKKQSRNSKQPQNASQNTNNNNDNNINPNNKQKYLNHIYDIYSNSKSKDKSKSKRKQKSSRNLKYSTPQDHKYNDEQQYIPQTYKNINKGRKSKQQLQNKLNQQLNRNALINNIQHYAIKNIDDKGSNGEIIVDRSKMNNQLMKNYNEQIRNIDQGIQRKRQIIHGNHNNSERKKQQEDENSKYNTKVNKRNKIKSNKKLLYMNQNQNERQNQYNNTIIKQSQRNKLSSRNINNDQLINISFSMSQQQQTTNVGKNKNTQNNDQLNRLMQQIQNDIQNLRNNQINSKNTIKSRRNNLINEVNETIINDSNTKINKNNQNAKGSCNYDNNGNSKIKSKKNSNLILYQDSDSLDSSNQQLHPNNNIINKKRNNVQYSFRPTQYPNNTDSDFNKQSNIFNIPIQQQQPNINKQNKYSNNNNSKNINDINDNINENNEFNQQQTLPHHQDYNIPLSQHKINNILYSIQNRIKFSPIVISQIPYQNQLRQNNNQSQIDNRYAKQTKNREQLKNKINSYFENKKQYNRFTIMCNKYPMLHQNRINKEVQKCWGYDQYGNKMMRDSKVWRSPGKSIKQTDKFKSLNTPLLNGGNCCKNQKINKCNIGNIFGKNQRKLMMCRSADTLQTMASNTFTNNMFKYKNNTQDKYNYKFRKIHTQQSQHQLQQQISDSYENYDNNEQQYKNENQNKCIMKLNKWDPIKKLRKQVFREINRIDNQYQETL